MKAILTLYLASHADVLRGSSRVPAHEYFGEDCITSRKNVCVANERRVGNALK